MTSTELYGGTVLVRFGEASHRYTISTNGGKTWDLKPGVTSILGSTLAKPMLMLWAMDSALGYLFGQKFEEKLQDDGSIVVTPIYEPSKALLQAGKPLTASELQKALETARGVHTQRRDKGGDIGHSVHSALEAYLTNGEMAPLPGPAGKSLQGFINWFEDQEDMEVLATEQIVYSPLFEYAGTYDALLDINGKKVLMDAKTTNYSRTAPRGIYADNFLQLGGYALAYQEEFGEGTIGDLLIVNASKTGKVNAVLASSLGFSVNDCIVAFTDAFNLHRNMNKLSKGLK